jgi:6-phosphogluconolactonase
MAPRGELRIEALADAEAVARRAAAFIAELAANAIAERGRFVMALSGGSTPWQMLRVLAQSQVSWPALHIVQVDERVAPSGDAERNLTHLEQCLRAGAAHPRIYPMPVEETDLPAAAKRYAEVLEGLAGAPPVLDLVQLGLGADGHTASLVPGDPVLELTADDVGITGLYQGRRRMTLTYPAINRARRILWLVTGKEKAQVVARFHDADGSLPASGIAREHAVLLTDRAAAEYLPPGAVQNLPA